MNRTTRVGIFAAAFVTLAILSSDARAYYDPQQGRFLTRDPIGYDGGPNPYAYAGDSPCTYTDPFGLKPLKNGNGSFDINEIQGSKGPSKIEMKVQFKPTGQCPKCEKVRLVQIARFYYQDKATGNSIDFDWSKVAGGAEANRNNMRTKSEGDVSPGFFVDHKAADCRPGERCSLYFRVHWANKNHSQDGSNTKPASLADHIEYGNEFDTTLVHWDFETCAKCATDDPKDTYLGCIKWQILGNLSIGSMQPLTGDVSDTPSPTFLKAVQNFREFYGIQPSP